ncbi:MULTISPECIES: hypothetical protein [Maribacter]|uniref:Uncharacterized protein n=1 Tax=Maribacter flavus TaxID=1658664 RepID=A0ABU7IJ88_9FLAO|nr:MULTISPECIES: hypothetical protein [Maribacter]MDC6405722.1 hypothetical protein [Maribacter sp. PR66]MEE1973026.1 hypothetical protein [Maribacter flavus]
MKSIVPIETSFSSIEQERKILLDQLASRIYKENRVNENTGLVFIDSNNKTKSQLAAIWLKTGLIKYELGGYNIQSAGIKVANEPLHALATLKQHGFKVSNASDKKLYSYTINFGSDSWNEYYKDLSSLRNLEKSLKVFVEDNLEMGDDPMQVYVPLDSPETIAKEMLYVASRIDYLTQSQKQKEL